MRSEGGEREGERRSRDSRRGAKVGDRELRPRVRAFSSRARWRPRCVRRKVQRADRSQKATKARASAKGASTAGASKKRKATEAGALPLGSRLDPH